MTQETITVIKRATTKYGLKNILPERTMILAIHRWATGWQELCFRNDEHFKNFAQQRNLTIF